MTMPRLTFTQRIAQQYGLDVREARAVQSLMKTGLAAFKSERAAVDRIIAGRKDTKGAKAFSDRDERSKREARLAHNRAFAATKGQHMSFRIQAANQAYRESLEQDP